MRLPTFPIAASLTLASCRFDTTVPFSEGSPATADADILPEPAPPDAAAPRKHLLLTEIKTAISAEEFIEIYNPTAEPVALDDYFLADNAGYASLAGVFGAGPTPDLHPSDFIARFPEGASIGPGEVQVVALWAPGFLDSFGRAPEYAFSEGALEGTMLPAYPDSLGASASLTDSGEAVVLFRWDGRADLVTDVDMVTAGASTRISNLPPQQERSGRGWPRRGRRGHELSPRGGHGADARCRAAL